MKPAAPVMNHFEFSSRKVFLPEKSVSPFPFFRLVRKTLSSMITMHKNGFAQKEIGKSVTAHSHVKVGVPMRYVSHKNLIITADTSPIFFAYFTEEKKRPISGGMNQSVDFATLRLVKNESEGGLFRQKPIMDKTL